MLKCYMKYFFFLSVLLVFSGCLQKKDPEDVPVKSLSDSISGSVSLYKEAPDHAIQVSEGQLPPVEERLPENPRLIQPVDTIGRYGGTWRMGLKNVKDAGFLVRTIGYENLVSWDPLWTRVIPNAAQSYEVSPDASLYTFYLRKGLKWSDGVPFTADDILFYYECMTDKNLTPGGVPSFLKINDEPVIVKKINDFTVSFQFSGPYGLFTDFMATPSASGFTSYPAHYLKQFHQKYNPEVSDETTPEGFHGWAHYLNFMARFWNNPDLPTIKAWLMESPYVAGETGTLSAVRNPFYWKIDTEYNQLPYIDKLSFSLSDNTDDFIDMALMGNIDMQERHISPESLRETYITHSDEGQFHFYTKTPSTQNILVIDLNQTHPDPVKREIYQNKMFRIGLSHALNRQLIIDEVYKGSGRPYQVAPRPESRFYSELLAKQYSEYNPDLAGSYLDKAGFSKLNNRGQRLGPDNQPITINLEIADVFGLDWVEALQYVKRDWSAVGISVVIDEKNWKDLDQSRNYSAHDAVVWVGEGGLDVILSPDFYLPVDTSAGYGMKWVWWYQKSEIFPLERPPESVLNQMQLFDRLKATKDPHSRDELMREILEITAEQFYSIGISLAGEGYGIVKNDFYNVPSVMPDSWTYPSPGPTNPCQYFLGSDE